MTDSPSTKTATAKEVASRIRIKIRAFDHKIIDQATLYALINRLNRLSVELVSVHVENPCVKRVL